MGGARGPTDMMPPESSAQVSTSTINTWVEWDVTQMAREWMQNPANNVGLKLTQDSAVATSATAWVIGYPDFYSRDYTTDLSLRPLLVVRAYVPIITDATRWELYR
jgi:hypothetical protein